MPLPLRGRHVAGGFQLDPGKHMHGSQNVEDDNDFQDASDEVARFQISTAASTQETLTLDVDGPRWPDEIVYKEKHAKDMSIEEFIAWHLHEVQERLDIWWSRQEHLLTTTLRGVANHQPSPQKVEAAMPTMSAIAGSVDSGETLTGIQPAQSCNASQPAQPWGTSQHAPSWIGSQPAQPWGSSQHVQSWRGPTSSESKQGFNLEESSDCESEISEQQIDRSSKKRRIRTRGATLFLNRSKHSMINLKAMAPMDDAPNETSIMQAELFDVHQHFENEKEQKMDSVKQMTHAVKKVVLCKPHPKKKKNVGLHDHQDEPQLTFFQCFVEDKRFNFLSGLVILLNAVFMSYESDVVMAKSLRKQQPEDRQLEVIELCFGGFYLIELSLRMSAYRMQFFKNKDWKWNMFDVFMVVFALQDFAVFMRWIRFENENNYTFMRLIRLLKLLKTLRTVRVLRMFRELRLMLHSIFGCVRTMVWATMLIILVTFLFGIFFTQSCSIYVASSGNADTAAVVMYWSSVMRAMNSLYMASTGGDSWRYMADILYEVGITTYFMFLAYIAFFLFVVMNTLTSLFIEAYMESAGRDDRFAIQQQLAKRKTFIQKFKAIYKQLDTENSGSLTWDQFKTILHDQEVRAFMSSLEIEASDVHEFFLALSHGGKRNVDLEAFVSGCMKLRGVAKSVDLVTLLENIRRTEGARLEFERRCYKQFDDLNQRLLDIRGTLLPDQQRNMPLHELNCHTSCKEQL